MEKFTKKNVEEIQNQRNLSAMLQMNDTLLSFLRALVVASTVTNPAEGSTSKALTFTNEIINEGGGFDTGTGRFTCPFGGIYYFNLHIMWTRYSSVRHASCYIDKTGLDTVTMPLGVSNSLYLRLAMGDVVTVSCYTSFSTYYESTEASAMESWSSFSGYMVRPNLLIPKDNVDV